MLDPGEISRDEGVQKPEDRGRFHPFFISSKRRWPCLVVRMSGIMVEHPHVALPFFHMVQCSLKGESDGILCGLICFISKLVEVKGSL